MYDKMYSIYAGYICSALQGIPLHVPSLYQGKVQHNPADTSANPMEAHRGWCGQLNHNVKRRIGIIIVTYFNQHMKERPLHLLHSAYAK